MNVADALATSRLPREDALPLLAHASGRSRSWLLAHHTDALPDAVAASFAALAGRRRQGEPVAYLVGRRAFWNIVVEVSPAVLIPRPETELLVERALTAIAPNARVGDTVASPPAPGDVANSAADAIGDRLRVLDLGAGSGAVALSIAGERPQAIVVASDVSAQALAVVARNASRLGLQRLRLVRGRWLDAFADACLDVIVSNPPYVAAGDPHLHEGDLRFEPRHALVAGHDGLDALRAIVSQAPRCLRRGGRLVVEHGLDQGQAVRGMFAAARFGTVHTSRDLAGHERVTEGVIESP